MPLLGRDVSVSGPFPEGAAVLLETLRGREELGQPYRFDLELLSDLPDIDATDVLGRPLSVCINLDTGLKRYFHGIVVDFAKTGITHGHTRYAAVLRPSLSLLESTRDCRVFNDPTQDALSIVSEVLRPLQAMQLAAEAVADHAYRSREYCVQYRESNFNLVQRLLEEEGIYYFFEHEKAKHAMRLADSAAGHQTAEHYESVPYFSKRRRGADIKEHFWALQPGKRIYPGRHTVLSGYDHTEKRPDKPAFGEESSVAPLPGPTIEAYDYPGGLLDPEEAQLEAAQRVDADRAANTTIEVEGNPMGLGVGHLVSLTAPALGADEVDPFFDAEGFGRLFLVVAAEYTLSINQYETGETAESDEPFRAHYRLQDSRDPFRPPRTATKPTMPGPQTALVVGTSGEDIDTDPLGRVKVQFDWDRLGRKDRSSSCWIRVAQGWAGAKWGAIFIPRIGHEVIVEFLDGDPDRPVITGSLYNADNMPPYDLPQHKTQSGIKSRSSKGGSANNFNEIRFEDDKGKEELHIQAEKDMSTLVKHDQSMHVRVDRSIEVGGDESTLVKHNRTTTVNVNDSVVVGGSHDKTVTGDVTQLYGADHFRKVDGDQVLVAENNKTEHVKLAYTLTTDERFQLNQDATSLTFEGTNVTLDSAGMVKLTAGGASVLVDRTGMITVSSPTGINLLCGGSGLSILPGAIAVTAGAVTAAAGPSQMEMGKDEVVMKSKAVSITAETTCSINGKSVLKLNTP